MITLPLKRLDQRSDLHPQLLLQQHINRSVRRLARMTGNAVPTDDDLRRNLEKRVASLADDPLFKRYNPYIPPALNEKRYNRAGTATAVDSTTIVLGSAGATATAAASGAAATDSGTADSVTPANTPSAANSLGLDIESTDIGYLATIQMGTPPQDFSLLMDSGSADMWVGGENCVSEAGGDCGPHTFLGTGSSSSFKDSGTQFQVTYGTGAVAGDIIQDNVVVAGLALDAHTFGVATTESVEFSGDTTSFDGLMGLAQSTLSNQGVPTPPESLAAAGLIAGAITSYKISRLADGLNDGEITFGGLDDTKFDPATLVTLDNVNAQGFWEAAVDSSSVDGTDLGFKGRTAILDTGTTLMIVPQADANAIHKQIKGATSDGQGGFTVPCTTTASVAITFGGQEFTIDPRDLAFTPVDPNDPTGDCVSGIGAGNIGGANEWLVGDTFLKNAYFSHSVDDNTLSLAKLV
ncbi:aspartic peptidase A1 [Hymenopellis radicata]|nr:aspartic peptidase A1 [Hymenopellis radicata]